VPPLAQDFVEDFGYSHGALPIRLRSLDGHSGQRTGISSACWIGQGGVPHWTVAQFAGRLV
jgi:hypothetical protein